MAKYRKKPVIIDAILWDGDKADIQKVRDFCEGNSLWLPDNTFLIQTLEGNMTASVGDYIIRGVNGEFYPCKPDIFEKTYEAVEDEIL